MTDKLVIAVIGNRHSGKSKTWNQLFGYSPQSGENRELFLFYHKYVKVYLVGSSPQEQHTTIEKILKSKRPRIVLCAIQYSEDARNTLKFFAKNHYTIFVHWLNPGFKDKITFPYDRHGLVATAISYNSLFGIRNGKKSPYQRVKNIKDFVYGWASRRGLVKSK